MRKMRIAAIAAITVLCLLTTWMTPAALATPATSGEQPLPTKASDSWGNREDKNAAVANRVASMSRTVSRKARAGEGEPLPSSYSSVELGYLTPIKDQDPWGTCWTFSAMACAETATLKQHLTNVPTPDYSEWALAYFAYNPVTDPLGGLAGDTITLSDHNYLDAGGNVAMSATALGSWRGVTDESLAPYGSANLDTPLDPSISYNDVLHLEDVQWLPMATAADREVIKRKLLEYGAADVSIYYDKDYYNARYGCYYTNSGAYTNHAVVLCGWDDSYPASNFAGSPKRARPSGNGAWLIRNSWNTDWGNDGYFWVSYYDLSMSGDIAAFYDFAPASRYDFNYQYDGVAGGDYLDFGDTHLSVANVYTAQHDEELRAVSNFYYNEPGGTYTVRVYQNVRNTADPTSGTLAATVTGAYDAMGMKTDELPVPVTLTQGTRFSVVYEVNSPDNLTVMASMDYEISGGTVTETGHNAGALGQSFYSYDGQRWYDGFDPKDELFANFRIHAYTKLPGGEETPSDPSETSETSETSEDSGISEASELSGEPSDDPSEVTSDDPSEVTSDVPPDDPSADLPSEPSEDPSAPTSEPSAPSENSDDVRLGDVNGDGSVDMKDVLMMRKFIANMDVEIDETAADVNGDGSVDMKDVLLLRKFIARLIETFAR